jgi:hypothetical protein
VNVETDWWRGIVVINMQDEISLHTAYTPVASRTPFFWCERSYMLRDHCITVALEGALV